MRSKITFQKDLVIKKVKASEFLFEFVTTNIQDYMCWMRRAGFLVPKTELTYEKGEIVFRQERIEKSSVLSPAKIISKIRTLSFENFGLDPNPGNFQGNDNEYFVDFFPFLARNNRVLSEQFDYKLDEVYARFFKSENVLLTYCIRLYKIDPEASINSIKYIKKELLEEFDAVLPREKARLLWILIPKQAKNSDLFEIYYKKTKRLSSITYETSRKLERMLLNI